MKIWKLKYVPFLIIWFCFNSFSIAYANGDNFKKTININNSFYTEDIYNALEQATAILDDSISLELNIINTSGNAQQLYLSIINPTIDKINIIDEKNKVVVLGDLIPFTKREFKHTNHVFPLFIDKDSSTILHIVIPTIKYKQLNVRIKLATETSFIKTTNHDNFFNGIYIGIYFMFILLMLCVYFFSKNNFFLIYLSIITTSLLLVFQYNGSGFQYLWFYSAFIQKYNTIFISILYFTVHILFISTFFSVQLRKLSKYFFRILLPIVICIVFFIVLQLYRHTTSTLYLYFPYIVMSVFLTYAVLVSLFCIYSYYESKRREVLWVFTGMIFYTANWLIFINNEFLIFPFFNSWCNFKLYNSDIFVPHLNYIISLLEVIAVTTFIAINYHKLIQQNNLSSKRLAFLQKRYINTFVLGQEEERGKISEEIELEISKDILQLKTDLQNSIFKNDTKNIIPSVLQVLDTTLTDIDNITDNYVAPNLQQMHLKELIITSTDKLFQEINTSYHLSSIPDKFTLNPVTNINLYRIFQEISNNALKHSQASSISISANIDQKSLQIIIKDNGIGFSENAVASSGIGLLNMESRINSLNGNLYIMSNEKKGTTIHLIMPLSDIL